MSGKLVIYVEKESAASRIARTNTIFDIGAKAKVNIFIDTEKKPTAVLTPREEPYVFNLEPGYHEIQITDGNAKSKKLGKTLFGGMTGALLGNGNMAIDAIAGASIVNNIDAIKQGVLNGDVSDGLTYTVYVKPVRNGLDISAR